MNGKDCQFNRFVQCFPLIFRLTSRDSLKDIERDPILVIGCDTSRLSNFLMYTSNGSLFTLKKKSTIYIFFI